MNPYAFMLAWRALARHTPCAVAVLAAAAAASPAQAQNTPFDDAPRAGVAASSPAHDAPRPRHVAAARVHARAVNQSHGGEPALSCRTVAWKSGDIVRIQAQPYKQVHVALPENGIDVIMGDKELWALDWINNRIFIKPTSRSSEGRSTTISAIGQSGNAYEFLVTRVPESAEISHCIYLTADPGLITRSAWQQAAAGGSESLAREVSGLRERNESLQRQSRESMKAYRKQLNSNYAWRTGLFSRWSGGEVESVYDDGRFTYVRMKDGAQGLVSITGDVDGKPMLLEYSYDSPTRTYQISGIFPKFTLRSGEQSLSITRGADKGAS
ncbi:MAG TPA: TrbG/VirB9 family P-type conjugative transfer protein [Albitalea sp.]|nr:TrbG/VirB9 family P-type conjugative transfer protein [Albitalea sp.]